MKTELNLPWQSFLRGLQKNMYGQLDKESFASFISKLNPLVWEKKKRNPPERWDLVFPVQRGYLAGTSYTAVSWPCKGILYMDKNWAPQITWSALEAEVKLCFLLLPRLSFHGSPTWCNRGFLRSLTACTSLSPHPSRHLPVPPSVRQNAGMAFCQLSPQTWLRVGSGQRGPSWGCHLPQTHRDPRAPSGAVWADGSRWNPSLSLSSGAAVACASRCSAWTVLPARLGWSWANITFFKQVYRLWCLFFVPRAKPSQKYRGFPSSLSTPLQGLALAAVTLKWYEQPIVRK